jgi:uncharacterized membrane protein YfcA
MFMRLMPLPDLAVWQVLLLCGVAAVAGLVDAVAGGGGLLSVPALLIAGMPPHLALGTNKAQAVVGTGTALWRFVRAGKVSAARARWMGPLGFLGSLAGAWGVFWVRPEVLTPLVMLLLAAAAVSMILVKPREGEARGRPWIAPLLALGIAAYDGFFGPGTGTFLIVSFTLLLGLGAAEASAEAKVVNFASNLAAVVLFASKDAVVWRVALPMAAAQIVGGWLGAHLTIRRGAGLVRGMLLLVTAALLVKLGLDLTRGA